MNKVEFLKKKILIFLFTSETYLSDVIFFSGAHKKFTHK